MKIHKRYACHPPARWQSMKIPRLTGLAATLSQDHMTGTQPYATHKNLGLAAILWVSPNRVKSDKVRHFGTIKYKSNIHIY